MVQTATCPLCEASCGIPVDADGEHVRSIRGDEDGPLKMSPATVVAPRTGTTRLDAPVNGPP